MRENAAEEDVSKVKQIALFPEERVMPEGFAYRANFISGEEEAALLRAIARIELVAPTMHGVAAKRRTAHFGHTYEFGTFKLTPAPPIPDFLLSLRERAAGLISRGPDELVEALVSEYPPGAPIGWHRDAPQFGVIIGISLLSACTMKLRAWPPPKGARMRPLEQLLAPRSAYVLDKNVRSQWQHHIPPAKETRYSITFRTLAVSGADRSHPYQGTA